MRTSSCFLALMPACAMAFAPAPSTLPSNSRSATATAPRCSQPAMSLGDSEVRDARRGFLAGGASLLTLLPLVSSNPAHAFENRVAPKGKYPGMNGAPKKGVGVGPDADGKLRFCGGEPNCFTSDVKGEIEDDPEHYYPPWEYSGKSTAEALVEIEEVVRAYVPGTDGIDGGGWKIAKTTPEYMWVQYESGKHQYIDDFEVALTEAGKVHVRSSSRLGYNDFAVNGKRINALAAALAKKDGWKTTQTTPSTHPEYWARLTRGYD